MLNESSAKYETWKKTDYLPDLEPYNDIILFLGGFTKNQSYNFYKLLLEKNALHKVMVCYNSNSSAETYQAFKMGVQRFINASSNLEELKIDFSHCMGDKIMQTYYPKDFVENIINRHNSINGLLINNLKEIEKEIIVKLWKGETNDEIADCLSISVRSVERYRSKLLKKTRSSNILGLMKKMLKEGMISI
jgi:DNA-binding NarL/FixJ family response regulator